MRKILLALILFLASAKLAFADLAMPQGRVILEISGKIGVGNADDAEGNLVALFDFAALARLPQTTLETTTEWTEGTQVFKGVLLRDILALLDASGESLRAVALNDYQATIPRNDVEMYDVLLALWHGGNRMRVRDKGPIWIIYPENERDSYLMRSRNLKMVWQLKKISVE